MALGLITRFKMEAADGQHRGGSKGELKLTEYNQMAKKCNVYGTKMDIVHTQKNSFKLYRESSLTKL